MHRNVKGFCILTRSKVEAYLIVLRFEGEVFALDGGASLMPTGRSVEHPLYFSMGVWEGC